MLREAALCLHHPGPASLPRESSARSPLPWDLAPCSPPPTKPASSAWKGSSMGISVEKEGRWGAGDWGPHFLLWLHSYALMRNDTAVSLNLTVPRGNILQTVVQHHDRTPWTAETPRPPHCLPPPTP